MKITKILKQEKKSFLYSLETNISASSLGFPGGTGVKNLLANAGDVGLIPWVRKIPWSRKWQPTLIFLIENATDRGAWWATVHRVLRELDTTAQHARTTVPPALN